MKDDDKVLKELFKKDLRKAPENPWFVKKVMNRLPEKESSGMYSWVEYFTYILAMLILVALAGYDIYGLCHSYEVTLGNILSLLSIGGLMLVVSIGFFMPAVRQWINEG